MIKKITFMRVALSFVIAICFGFLSASSMRVYAYTDSSLVYNIDCNLDIYVYGEDSNVLYHNILLPDQNNIYQLDNELLTGVKRMSFYLMEDYFTFPFNPEYDYYFIGSLIAPCTNSEIDDSTFKPSVIRLQYTDVNNNAAIVEYSSSDVNVYNIDGGYYKGFGFYEKVDFMAADNIGISRIHFMNDAQVLGNKPANLDLQLGVMAIPKSSDSLEVTRQILNKLSDMESSITSSIDANTSAINSIGESIVNKLSSVFEELTSDLSSWFSEVKDNLDSNFSALLDQNSEEHEELINGYQGTGTQEASEKFDQSAGELESVEKDLTNITNTSVDNYATSAFDSSIITTLGPSLVYVVTWFTNFWNMGGIFTSLLNVGLALFVAFFILRLHGG